MAARAGLARIPRAAWWLAAAVVLGGLAGLLPPVQSGAKAVGVGLEAFELPAPRPFAHEPERRTAQVGGVEGHLYVPERRAPAVLLVPGATPAGLTDRRTGSMAEALAAAGRVVFVPQLALYEQRLAEEDLDALVRSGRALVSRPETLGDDVALLGFSFGGSLALLAAADPQLSDHVAHVAVMGAYVDLVGVIEAATTGETLVDGQRQSWEAHPDADAIVRRQALELVDDAQRDVLAAALDSEHDPADLPDHAAAVHALIANGDVERTRELVARLPRSAQHMIERFSPERVLDDIVAPITALHDRADPAVPFAELHRLERAAPQATSLDVELFDHVDPAVDADAGPGVIVDGWRVWRFGWRLLRDQERALSAFAPGLPSHASSGADSSSSIPRVSGSHRYKTANSATGAASSTPASVNVPSRSASTPKAARPLTDPSTPDAASQPAAVARTEVGNTSASSAPPDGV